MHLSKPTGRTATGVHCAVSYGLSPPPRGKAPPGGLVVPPLLVTCVSSQDKKGSQLSRQDQGPPAAPLV